MLKHFIERSLSYHMTAVNTWSGSHLDDMVGSTDGIFVVLHHDHAIADIAQLLEGGDHFDVIARMQANARLIQHVEHTHQPRTDLRGEAKSLVFAPRKGGRPAVQVQVVEADSYEQTQTYPDFRKHLLACLALPPYSWQVHHKGRQLGQVHLAQFIDVLTVERDRQALLFEPLALAIGATVFHHHAAQIGFHIAVRNLFLPVVLITPLDDVDDAIETEALAHMLITLRRAFGQHDRHFLPPRAVEENIDGFG